MAGKGSRFLSAAGVVLMLMSAGVAAQDPPRGTRSPGEEGDYRIGPGDVLDIVIWKDSTMSRTVVVRPDGMISLPLLNDVRAEGMTPMALRGVLMQKLSDYIPAPEAAVIVREIHSFKVSVMGEVRTPGRYELDERATVLDAIAHAGGLTEFASGGRVEILRAGEGALQRIRVKLRKAVAGKIAMERLLLQPGDTIVVP